MARFQLIIPDEDHDRFAYQARLEGMSLSGWLRAAAKDRIEQEESASNHSLRQRMSGNSFRPMTTAGQTCVSLIGTNTSRHLNLRPTQSDVTKLPD